MILFVIMILHEIFLVWKKIIYQCLTIYLPSIAVKSGGYYMFDDKETDVCDLSYNTRESLIPDPEGREIKNIAKSKGFTAVS